MAIKATGNFEGGNALVERITTESDGATVYFAAQHKRGGPQALWFYLRVDGVTGQRLRCVLTNTSQTLGGADGWARNAPVYRLGRGPWHRVEHAEIWTDGHLVPHAIFTIDVSSANGEPVELAACYPYLSEDLNRTLSADKVRETWSTASIGYTPEGRPLRRLYNTLGDAERTLPGVFLIARQHSGETPGSWMLDGILRYLSAPQGSSISRGMCVWSVPIADPDGVADGAYGKDQFPWDLNRAWGRPIRPETHAIQSDVVRWTRRCKPVMIVDLHAPAHQEKGFYFWAPTAPASIARVTHKVAERFRERVPEPLRGTEPAFRRWGVTDTSVQKGQSCISYGVETLGYPTATLEMSYQGPDADSFYSQEDYRLLGQVLIETLYEIATSEP